MAVPKKKLGLKIRAFMTPHPQTIGPHETLAKAHEQMTDAHVRHLPVVENGEPVGLVSERDLLMIERYRDVDPLAVEVYEAMAPLPYMVAPNTPLDEVVKVMEENRHGSALVVDGGKVVGVFTTVDALRATRKLCREATRRAG